MDRWTLSETRSKAPRVVVAHGGDTCRSLHARRRRRPRPPSVRRDVRRRVLRSAIDSLRRRSAAGTPSAPFTGGRSRRGSSVRPMECGRNRGRSRHADASGLARVSRARRRRIRFRPRPGPRTPRRAAPGFVPVSGARRRARALPPLRGAAVRARTSSIDRRRASREKAPRSLRLPGVLLSLADGAGDGEGTNLRRAAFDRVDRTSWIRRSLLLSLDPSRLRSSVPRRWRPSASIRVRRHGRGWPAGLDHDRRCGGPIAR